MQDLSQALLQFSPKLRDQKEEEQRNLEALKLKEWEEKYDLEDALGDNDDDGLTNLEEYELRTNPIEADTDSDGLSDGAEVALKSSPLISDTDNDGLNDKEESDIGTNPTKEDTDDDGFSDLKEVEAGSNP